MSFQQTKEQERAAAAWTKITGCLQQAIQDVRRQVDSLQRRVDSSPSERDCQRLEELRKKLSKLESKKGGREWQESFASHVKKLPMLVLANGLGATLAFLKAKGKNDPSAEEEVLYRQISQWVTGQIWGGTGDANLLTRLIASSSDSNVYRRATTEALAFAVWLKRFAEAELEAEPDLTPEAEEESPAATEEGTSDEPSPSA
jgi:CRISPR-associated protein Cmr5